MVRYILPFLIAGSVLAEVKGPPPHGKMKKTSKVIHHAGLTREEVARAQSQEDLFPIHDIVYKETVFVTIDKANEYFLKSLNYYNKALFRETKKAIIKAKKEEKKVYVNIVGGSDIPEHAFGARNNVYKIDDYPNGQYTIFYVTRDGKIWKDHYHCGEYGKLGRDGVSFEHAVKTFGASDIKKAVDRARASNKAYDWEVTVEFPDTTPTIHIFDTYDKYEEWMNRTRYPLKYSKVAKIPGNVNFPELELSNK
tara:strand:- start:50 stop:805 length:756 start_codon:yes stop_codon:yes gene_type:complete